MPLPDRPDGVLFLVPGFPADARDTACLPAVQNYVAAYAARHPERAVHVVAFQYPFSRACYRWRGVTVHALAGRNRPLPARLGTWIRSAGRILRIARRCRVRVVHSFWLGECAWIGQWLSLLLRVRHVASIGGQDARAGNPYLKGLALRRATITAGSEFAAETYRRSTGKRVDAVVPLGLDTEHLRGIGRPPQRDVDLLGVGSLTPVKDYAAFVELVGQLVPARPRLRAVLVGDGPQRGELMERIDAKGLRGHVELTGHLPRDEAYGYMLRSRILLHPSRYEGQGYVFLEALQAGMHVVSREVGYGGSEEGHFQCRTETEMLHRLRELLQEGPPPAARSVVSADETAAAFHALYERGA